MGKSETLDGAVQSIQGLNGFTCFLAIGQRKPFFPVGSLSSEACEHNLEIVRRVLENSPKSEAIKGIAVWYEFRELLVESIQSAKPIMMDKKRETQLVEFVSARC